MSNTYIEKVVTWRHGENTLYAGTPVDNNMRPANNGNAIGIVAEDLNHPDKVAKVLIAGEWNEDLFSGRIILKSQAKRAMNRIAFAHPPVPSSEDFVMSVIMENNDGLVTNLTENGELANGFIVDVMGIPTYVDDVAEYSSYQITDPGWYVFARIQAREDAHVTADLSVEGSAGYIAEIGKNYIDVAVKFGVTAMSQKITIDWGEIEDTYVFKATDLAMRNLDYRTTFYVYDIANYAVWSYALTTDETFVEGTTYYTENDGVYTEATVTAGETIPADTYYVHSKLTFSGMVRNVTYRFNEMVDAPIEIVLPEVPDDGYGAWFEIQMQYNGNYSCTLLPEDSTVLIGTASTQAQNAGINVIDLQYSNVNGVKMWTLLNTHSNLPTEQEGT